MIYAVESGRHVKEGLKANIAPVKRPYRQRRLLPGKDSICSRQIVADREDSPELEKIKITRHLQYDNSSYVS